MNCDWSKLPCQATDTLPAAWWNKYIKHTSRPKRTNIWSPLSTTSQLAGWSGLHAKSSNWFPSIVVSGVRYLDATIADHSLSWLHLGKNWAQLKGAATRLLLAKLDPTTSVVDTWRSMMCMAYTWHRWRKWKIKSGRVAIHSIPSNARSAGRIPHDASALT